MLLSWIVKFVEEMATALFNLDQTLASLGFLAVEGPVV